MADAKLTRYADAFTDYNTAIDRGLTVASPRYNKACAMLSRITMS